MPAAGVTARHQGHIGSDTDIDWGEQHDRLLSFVYRIFRCSGRDVAEASAMTVELFGENARLVTRPDLGDDTVRAHVVRLVTAMLGDQVTRGDLSTAVRQAAFLDSVTRRGLAEIHESLSTLEGFTRHMWSDVRATAG
ncbi:MAG: hypothetical protein M3443_13470 [Actinomycetota bacterium]|nr:hypothetical protein [Actinomycetota bacterium]